MTLNLTSLPSLAANVALRGLSDLSDGIEKAFTTQLPSDVSDQAKTTISNQKKTLSQALAATVNVFVQNQMQVLQNKLEKIISDNRDENKTDVQTLNNKISTLENRILDLESKIP